MSTYQKGLKREQILDRSNRVDYENWRALTIEFFRGVLQIGIGYGF